MSEKTTDEKSKSRGHWNMLFSGGDPELLELANYFRGFIPDNSLFHSRIIRRIVGVFKAWAESKAESLSPFAGALVEKATDIADMMMGEAAGHDDEHEATKKATKVTEDWIAKMFADAGKRLEKAADPTAELEKIKKEFAARVELLKIIEAAMKEAEEKKAAEKKPTSVEGPPLEVGKKVDNLLDTWKTRAQSRGYKEGRKP